MDKKLFYSNQENPKRAHLLGRSYILNNPQDINFLADYISFFDKIIKSSDCDYDQAFFYIDQIKEIFSVCLDKIDYTESIVKQIEKISGNILKIQENLESRYNKEKTKINNDLLKHIEKEIQIQSKNEIKDFSLCSELDSLLDKTFFTQKQQKQYDELTKELSFVMQKNLRQQQFKTNQNALCSFKEALEKFDSSSEYRKDAQKLWELIVSYFLPFANEELFPETSLYYNYVFGFIFEKLNDKLKVKFVEYTIQIKK